MDDTEIDIKNVAEKLIDQYNTIEDGYNLNQLLRRGMYVAKN